MFNSFNDSIKTFFKGNIIDYFKTLNQHPFYMIATIIDIAIVLFFIYFVIKRLKDTRAWQLLKGIIVLILITLLSGWLKLRFVNFILSSVMTYGVFLLIVVFQPELRRMLEQIGSNSNFTKFIGFVAADPEVIAKKKENVYRIVIAALELAKTKTGALIVIERDIHIQDIIKTGIPMNCDISPQILCNIFVPNTPLHDGAVVISDWKIAAAACMLPLSDDQSIARELGTRHRAAIGVSKESDAIVVVVSEETGKISIARNGTLIADVKEDVLKKILIKNLVTEPVERANRAKAELKLKEGKKSKFLKKIVKNSDKISNDN